MANEKLLLQKELERWECRRVEIESRLAAIAAKERRLMAVIQGDRCPRDSTHPAVRPPRPGAGAAPAWLAQAEPVRSGAPRLPIKVQEFSY